jgi:hypothetical protein
MTEKKSTKEIVLFVILFLLAVVIITGLIMLYQVNNMFDGLHPPD